MAQRGLQLIMLRSYSFFCEPAPNSIALRAPPQSPLLRPCLTSSTLPPVWNMQTPYLHSPACVPAETKPCAQLLLTSSTLPPMWNTHTVPAETMIFREKVDLATSSAMGSLPLLWPNPWPVGPAYTCVCVQLDIKNISLDIIALHCQRVSRSPVAFVAAPESIKVQLVNATGC